MHCTTCIFLPAHGKVYELKCYIYNLIFASFINLMFKLNATTQNSHKKFCCIKKSAHRKTLLQGLWPKHFTTKEMLAY